MGRRQSFPHDPLATAKQCRSKYILLVLVLLFLLLTESQTTTTATRTISTTYASLLPVTIPSEHLHLHDTISGGTARGGSKEFDAESSSLGRPTNRQNHCPSSSFQCTDGTCIPFSWKCDSKNDCPDRSDESGCSSTRNCNSDQFECRITQRCVPKEWLCDGDFDCGPNDTSDEDSSKCRTTKECLPNQSECSGGICIDTVKFCDGKFDCINDEYTEFCDNSTLTAECIALNCTHGCKPTPLGAKCYCSRGQQPHGPLCEDFDECSIEGNCDQICKNIPYSFECSCVAGYESVNETMCKGINVPSNESASLVFMTENEIKRVSLSGNIFIKSQQSRINVQTLDIWHANRSMCLINGSSDSGPKEMTCFNIDDFSISWSFPRPEITTGLSSVDQLRLDWTSGNWYFVNTNAGMIILCNHKMTICSIVVEIYGQKLNSFEIDPTKGYMFFMKFVSFGSLHRGALDGSNQTTIDSYKIIYPTSLTLDLANEHVYWVDKYMDSIERVDYYGKNRWSLKKTAISYPLMKSMHSIALFENIIFFTSRTFAGVNGIVAVNKRDSDTAKMIITNDKHPLELRVFHRQRQPDVMHPCTNGGGCEQLCVPAYRTNGVPFAQCLCSAGYRLNTRTQCVLVKHSSFLIYAKQSPAMIRGISMSNVSVHSAGAQESIVPILNVKWPLSLDYNVREQVIYFGQNDISGNEFIIEAQKIDGTGRKVVLRGRDHCHGIAYDWIGNNMFWASSMKIEVFSLENINISKTLVYTVNAGSLALDPKKGFLYWSTWASHDNKGQIMFAWMDGTHKQIFADAKANDMQWPSSLTIDFMEQKLYWCDPRTKTIERISLDGKDREIIIQRVSNEYFYPFSMAYYNEYIFYTDIVMGNITKVHIKNAAHKEKYEVLAHENRRVTDIKVFDNLTQSDLGNCRDKSCPGMLLATPSGCICVCGNGFSLNPSGMKCIIQMKTNPINECGTDRFQCVSNNECIEQKYLCDGDNDCNDGSDESYVEDGPCNAKHNCTNLGEKGFRCDEDRCIRNSSVCDGVTNCFDGSDENPEHCTSIVCAADKFQCKQTKQCIPKNWLCDGHIDCADRSDEMENCSECVEFRCNNSLCVPSEKLCDGVNDCGDHSDEAQCEHQCRRNEYFCHPKGCLSSHQLCDGIVDCFDATDEEGCEKIPSRESSRANKTTNRTLQCSLHEYRCMNQLECVPRRVRCDGYNDCFDRSDEINCTKIRPLPVVKYNDSDCSHPDRLCQITGPCIRVHQLCDGRTDCPDGSDEGVRCDEKLCDHNSECSHFCHNAPEGFVCSCPLHLFLKPNGLTCSQDHACEDWGTCSQICEQVGKRYKCKCRDGFTLQYDNFTCRSDNADPPYVIFSNREEIRGVDLKTLGVKNFFASLRNTIAIDFLLNNQTLQIFWTDVIDDKIYRGTLIGDVLRNIEPVVQSGLLTAEGLAVDWIGHNLYWVDSNLDQIEVAHINGSFRRTLIAGDMSSPRAIALDPREGLLFWTDWDKHDPRIERCSMAGEHRQTIIQVDKSFGGWPNGLTLDYAQKRVYYIDAHSDSIHTTNYDGGDHHLVIRDQETLSHPFSISLFENHVYWTDWRTNSVMRANKWNGSDITVIDRTSSQPFGIQILHSSRQPHDGVSPCAPNNGGCSHLCLLSLSQTYKCECPHVMRLNSDNKTCVQNEQVLLFIMGSEIRGVDISQPNHHIIPTISHTNQVLGPNVIDFLYSANQLFWSDKLLNEVKTSGLANANIDTILDTDLNNLSSFAIDWIAKNIYVANEKNGLSRIIACNLRGEYMTEILTELLVVTSIALDPRNGKLYFAHEDDDSNTYLIEQCAMDGSNRKVLVNSTKTIGSLTMDYLAKRLYFVFMKIGAIQYLDIELSTTHEVLPAEAIFVAQRRIESITVYKEEIFFAETTDGTIRKCDKNDCIRSTILRNNTNSVPSLKMYHAGAQVGDNSCAGQLNNCAHLCLATSPTEHVCKCAIGYYSDAKNPTKCIGEKDFLLFSIGHELKGIRLPENDPKIGKDDIVIVHSTNDDELEHVLAPIPRVSLATNIDYHYRYDLLFWGDSDKGEIISIKRDGTERRVIVNQTDQFDGTGGDWLCGIAVDWVADNIYWSDEKRNIIEVARLNGSSRYVALSYVSKPKAIAVDPIAGYLFYAGDKKIERTGLDGSQHFILANQSAQVTNLVLDTSNQVVYWCELTSDTIWRADYDGNSKTIMLNHSLDNPVALALYDSNLYWADNSHHRSSIKVAPVSDLSQFQLVSTNDGNSLSDLKIFSDKVQNGENACAVANGGCQELCLFNGTHPICACSHGEVSTVDGKSCVSFDEFLIYSRVVSIESIHLTNHLNMNSPIVKIQHAKLLRNTIGLSYNYGRRRIFYSDVHSSSINWVFFNGSNHQIIVNKQVSVEGLAYDAVSDQLFWTSNSDASIRAIDLSQISTKYEGNNELVKQVIQLNAHDKPRGIAVESCLGMVYWTNWNSEAASIQRAYITGYNLENIITTDIRMPNAITLDYEGHKLYWADARLDKIERVDYDGSHRVVLVHSTPKHPFAMAVYKNYLYWTDWVLRAVLRVNKYSGVDVVWLRKDIGRLMGIVAVQNTTQECSASPCSVLNGGCEDVCSAIDGKVKCECTTGKLAADGRHCVPNRQCQAAQFTCKSKECIPFHLTCDTVAHCMDGSDEDISYCNIRVCPSNYFMCNNHRCIPTNQTCDGVEHCGDGSDEAICECETSHYKCGSGQCIDKSYRCDSDIDCPDGTDEMNCPNKDKSCTGVAMPGVLIKCANTSMCYMESWRCDGENDCWDKSDEMNCPNPTCTDDKFQCKNGRCINMAWRCDGETDCTDGSDEANCYGNGTLVCKSNYFGCADSQSCIPETWQCDENPDCNDGSDEGEHCAKRECDELMFRCPKSGRCIPLNWKCDGDMDCQNGGEDEMNCYRLNCPDSMFECDNHQCIDFVFHCDGSKDCSDGSDEYPGCIESPLVQSECGKNQFRCDNGHCLPKSVMCNLSIDCEDGSDENITLCKNSTLICAAPDFYRCGNGACVSEDKLCNGENDCGDFSDEQTCNVNECTRSVERKLCAHICEDRKVGYECTCNVGFKVSHKDRHMCEDVNECLNRPCSQICTNSYGSYHCSCADGYALKDKHICKAVTTEQVKLIFSNRYYLRETDLQGHSTLIAHNLSNAVALDYDWETKCYYWSDVTSTISKIKRMCPSDNKTVEIHHTLLKNPDGLAVEWVAKNLYWCDKGLDTIEVSKLDGRYRKVLIKKDLQEPRAIAVDPFEKYIYWTDWGDRPHIGKAGLDGSNQRIIAEDGFGWPNALTISFETKELFWGDAREDFIGVSDLEGRNRKIIMSRETNPLLNLHHVFALAVWEDRIYWTDWETKSIESCHKDRGDNCSTLLTTIHRPMDIRVFHSYRQRSSDSNPCLAAACETLCLLSPDPPYYKCDCPNNFYLAADNRSCIANCTSAQFECSTTKKCIPFFWRCDSQDDCGDNSDEPASCRPFNCEPGEYQCFNEKCISPGQICDGKDQCGDNSDEIECDKYVCFDKQFKCSASTNKTSFCIDNTKRCDGIPDCPNGEDESECLQRDCPKEKFKCNDGKCIPQVWACDGDNDCSDHSDEQNCQLRSCSGNEFKCDSGRCIPKSWQCDGEFDCPGREDEPSVCKTDDRKCTDPGHFRCNNGKCIPKRWQCDYDFDCSDKSDEINCTMRNCSESEFRCANGRCIPGRNKCDGEFNCVDFSDEENCNVTCSYNEFKCPNHNFCISNQFLCDGDNDCADGADELNCTCAPNQFQCKDGRCIENRWRCDGWMDCLDNSDETIELCSGISCGQHAHRCRNKRCIKKSALCDGNNDCGDNSDESSCSVFHKCSSKQFQCERDQFCISKQFRCDGEPNCVDDSDEINCKAPVCGFGVCSQICLEKKSGNYNCRCADGYVKGPEKNDSCVSLEEPLLLIASDKDLRFLLPQKQMDSEIHGLIPISQSKIDVFDVRILPDTIFLYWIDVPNRDIQKLTTTTFNNTFRRKVKRSIDQEAITIITTIANPKSLAIDWIGERIYIVDASENQIISTDLNGGEQVTIVPSGVQPLDIVVEPSSRMIFWSTLENGILSASMDGTNKQALIEGGVEWPTGLTIDYPTQRLYWADHRKGTIETSLLNGKSRHIVTQFRNRTMLPKRIQVFEDSLYITLYDQTIFKINKFGHNKGEVLVESFQRASDLFILHPLRQDLNITNPCQQHPCQNQHICLLSSTDPTGRACKCPDHLAELIDRDSGLLICRSPSNNHGPCLLECNQGICKVINNQQKCKCPLDYEGEFCEHYRCSGYCKNRGVCYVDASKSQMYSLETKTPLKCKCQSSWTGDRCDIPVATCREQCHNGATCTVTQNGVENCICPSGYYGRNCQHCEELRCENQGVCMKDTNGVALCDCPDDYKGVRCENSICEGYCSGHGQCTIRLGNPQCECEAGFWGRQCQSEECTDYCVNGGTCQINGLNVTICDCPENYSGARCEHYDPNADRNPCNDYVCQNGGTCHVIKNEAYCNCTSQWNGPNCQMFLQHIVNPCIDYCENNAICRLDHLSIPSCVCDGEWSGTKCNRPPACVNSCGDCILGSSINECVCVDGTISSCTLEKFSKALSPDDDNDNNLINILCALTVLFIILILVFGSAIYILRRRRICQPFSHARLNDCVEMTNPMYLGEIDDTPAFIHEESKQGRFTNPVYESMYAGSSEPSLLNAGSCNGIIGVGSSSDLGIGTNCALEEKTGLLEQDEPSLQDLL